MQNLYFGDYSLCLALWARMLRSEIQNTDAIKLSQGRNSMDNAQSQAFPMPSHQILTQKVQHGKSLSAPSLQTLPRQVHHELDTLSHLLTTSIPRAGSAFIRHPILPTHPRQGQMSWR